MKLIFTFVFAWILLSNCFGQVVQTWERQFALDIIHKAINENKPLIYCPSLDELSKKEILQRLQNSNTFFRLTSVNNKLLATDSVTLTNTEKEHIIRSIFYQPDSTTTWVKTMFPNARILLQDTLQAISKDKTRGRDYFNRHYGAFIRFSKPLFFRSSQLCAFYLETNVTFGGGGMLAIYRLNNGKWEFWIPIYEWYI
jgi:hypothetical protein